MGLFCYRGELKPIKTLFWNICSPNLDKFLTGIWIWNGDASLAASVNGSLFKSSGHDYAVSASLCWQWRACTSARSCALCECHYCLLLGSRQVTWLLCLSLCSSDKLNCLSQWMIEQHVRMHVCECVCAATLGHCKYTGAILWEHNLILYIYHPSGHVSIQWGAIYDVCRSTLASFSSLLWF